VKQINVRRWFTRAMTIPPLRAVRWQASNRMFLGTFIGTLAAIYLFVLLVDPYGVVPFSLPFDRPLMTTQRQMYPQILRTGRYDSVVVGTSTSRLLDPAALDRALGGHFASFAMLSETAQEQLQIIDYFRRTVAVPKAVVIGLDHEWCYRNSTPAARESAAAREREFPFWAYDDNRWNDLFYLLNIPTVDAAGRTVAGVLGWFPGNLRQDGYAVLQPEPPYDAARARYNIWGQGGLQWFLAVLPGPGDAEAETNFTALPWLDESLARMPVDVKKYLLLPPVHIHMLPEPGSPREAREAECKRRIATIARRRGATLVDWRIVSPLSSEDAHFVDPLHYRLPVAYRLIDDLDHIVNEGRESPDGSYRILVR
jgi:hypothetical protein